MTGFDFRRGLAIFLLDAMIKPILGPTQPPIQWLPRELSLPIKWPENEADHSPPSSAKVKECVEIHLHSPIRLQGVVLVRHRDNFIFTFTLPERADNIRTPPDSVFSKDKVRVVSFEAFTAMMFQEEVFWVLTPCGVVVRHQRFGGPCFLHLQGEVTGMGKKA
jgi:hypothetical protein